MFLQVWTTVVGSKIIIEIDSDLLSYRLFCERQIAPHRHLSQKFLLCVI